MYFNQKILSSTLENLPEIIEMYVSNIPNDIFDLKRNEETWTIREHIYHVASVQNLLYKRIEIIKDLKNPIIKPFFPEKQVSINEFYKSIEDAFKEYKSVRKFQIELIDKLSEDDFNNEANHGEYISYNIPIIMNHIIFHEYWHMYRIEEIWLSKNEYFK